MSDTRLRVVTPRLSSVTRTWIVPAGSPGAAERLARRYATGMGYDGRSAEAGYSDVIDGVYQIALTWQVVDVGAGSTVLMTLAEASESLGVNASTLRRQAAAGVLAATVHGKTYMVDAEEVERYRAAHLGRPGRPRKP